jgi:adenylate cyclase
MPRLASPNRVAIVAGVATLLLVNAAHLLFSEGWLGIAREKSFDVILGADRRLIARQQREDSGPVVVVDIDRRSLEDIGPWPWPREKMADLADAVAAAKPAAVAFDILFAEPDDRSPAALARRLATLTDRAGVADLAKVLPDGDQRLANAFGSMHTVLGFVLDPEQPGSVSGPPTLVRGSFPLSSLWRGAGALGPAPSLSNGHDGIGALSLPADVDGVIRRVPLFLGAGERLLPGLAIETVRVLRGAPDYALQSDPPLLRFGETRLPLPPDGMLRLIPESPDRYAARTVSAADLLHGAAGNARIAGATVVVGGSAPELGGLRNTPGDPLTPDAQIQADAINQILAVRVPLPLQHAAALDFLLLNLLGLLMLSAGVLLAPFAGVLTLGCVLVLTIGSSVMLSATLDRLLDPLTPSIGAVAVFAVTSICAYAVTYRREALIRRRFEQHLAPAVVRRIVDEPELLKLNGERRQVTALFTDIESFTAMTHRADPEQLIAVLDQYFEGCAGIIFEHGGMIDKIVGDAVHALFNAPLDLPNHPERAVTCAIALRRWSADFRRTALPAALGFGRTRIGIETGEAIVGDVGIRAKLDYTAHGDAVNAAARLEAANKELGSSICVGPEAASHCDAEAFRPLGEIILRGREELHAVFEPWPDATPADWRKRYLAAFDLIRRQPAQAAGLFDALALQQPDDPVASGIAERIRRSQ